MPPERASGTKCVGGRVGSRLILNALEYRQEPLTPTENRVTDTPVSCLQPDHYIDNVLFLTYIPSCGMITVYEGVLINP